MLGYGYIFLARYIYFAAAKVNCEFAIGTNARPFFCAPDSVNGRN
jgi:hypothetical protein